MSQPQPETEYASNLLSDAIDALRETESALSRLANRCAGGPLQFCLELERAIERSQEFAGELESLMSDAEAFDEASEEETEAENE